MSRFQVSNPLPSPSPSLNYAFSCLSGKQTPYAKGFNQASIAFTTLADSCYVGGQPMTLIHFYVACIVD